MEPSTAAAFLGRIHDRQDEERRRAAALGDPGSYHGEIAAAELHWFEPAGNRWLSRPDGGGWSGWSAADGAPLEARDLDTSWRPWKVAFDDAEAPFFRWFAGGLTNACFNEVDRHVLGGRGEATAFVFEGDRWDPSKNDGRGGPVVEDRISYRRLLLETVRAAEVLTRLGLGAGDRVAFNLPNIPQQIVYTEAAKRLGVVYTPVFGGFSAKTLADRIADAGARVLITADGGYRNAEVVPYKESFADRALDGFLRLDLAFATLAAALAPFALGEIGEALSAAVADALAGEITVERSDVMRELGRELARRRGLDPGLRAALRTAVARALAEAGAGVETVVVVRHTGQEVVLRPRDRWSHELLAEADRALAERLGQTGPAVGGPEELLALDDRELWRRLAGVCPARPVDAEWPLFVIYTSGSTGKPKGVVHTHGGFSAGVAHTMRVVFGATAQDCIYVVADPGWITGQSYLVAGPLTVGIPSIQVEASPVFPNAGRFSSVIERHGVTIFKAGSTFLKTVMTDPDNVRDMERWSTRSLKVATFCAEPVSPVVQQFAMERIVARYINSYWATEHGGMVLSCPWGDLVPLAADARTWALPWIEAEVRIAERTDETGRAVAWRRAETGEKGELVLTRPYPYLARTLWGDAERLGTPGWRGDLERFRAVYFERWAGDLAYTQGDYARAHGNGCFTLHGRSDDVINTSGHRIGTEEIEGAILRDKLLRRDSAVGNAVVVGAPDEASGETPVAFLVPAPGRTLRPEDARRLADLVRAEKGSAAVPSEFLTVSQFPETRSGKYMRRMLRAILLDEPLGDTSTLRNPEAVDEVRQAVEAWRARLRVTEDRRRLEVYRTLRVENHPLADGREVAIVSIDHPPVNALNERSLDELHTVLTHLGERQRTAVVVVTGAGTGFVAGADIKELLAVGEAGDPAGAITLPNAAHQAFAALERLGKPALAAVNGAALGGGNELVLASTYVVAEAGAVFGQPEINLGLLPGYGGTQRLARTLLARRGAAGLAEAVRVMVGGRSLSADEAAAAGWVDEVVDGGASALERAVVIARSYARGEGPLVAAEARARRERAERERPRPGLAEVLRLAEVETVIGQARRGGRATAVERLLEALETGLERGFAAGIEREATLFAEALTDPAAGPAGIRAFLEKRSDPLPSRVPAVPPLADEAARSRLEAQGRLLPLESPFYPGVTPVPELHYALGVVKDGRTGAPAHGDPVVSERLVVVPTPRPGPNEALVYVLASEVNFNDIWALTGIPISPFDGRDVDVHVTGSGGVGLVVELGEELRREGRVALGQLVTLYSGQSELLSPDQGLDPMSADFRIQGYERADGTHAQFVVVQGPQLHRKLPDLTLEQAGSFGLNLGTIHRALATTLDIRPGQRLFVEGAATGTGLECVRTAVRGGLRVVGTVSSPARVQTVRGHGAQAVDRKDPRWAEVFVPVPESPEAIERWLEAGRPFVEEVRRLAGGPLDLAVSHAGERSFPRAFQLLGDGGVLAFFGASSGYRFTFVGRPGSSTPQEMLLRSGARSGTPVLVVYGPGAEDGVVDEVGVEAIDSACSLGARVAVLASTTSQREFVASLGFGEGFAGVVALDDIAARLGGDFDPPGPLPPLPSPFRDTAGFQEAVRRFTDRTLKPIGAAVGPLLRTQADARGLPEVVFERRGHDGLSLATALVRPVVGRVAYSEDLGGRGYSFYAPQVWMRQRRILMPTAEIRGTHLNTAHEFATMQGLVAAEWLDLVEPVAVSLADLPAAHQAMWENRHAGANYVALHAVPHPGLKSRDELLRAWARREAEAKGEAIDSIDTGSAGALR